MTASNFKHEVAVPELGGGYKLRLSMVEFAAIEQEFAREDPLFGVTEYWSRVADLLNHGSADAVLFVVGVGLRDQSGEPVKEFAWSDVEVTIDQMAAKCLDALALGRFGKTYDELLKHIEERNKSAEEAEEAENPPNSPDTGSNG